MASRKIESVSGDSREEAAAVWVSTSELHPWDKNPRDNKKAIKKVADSIKRFGFGAPILARTNGEIIAGHTRWAAAQTLKLDRVPVRYLDLDPAEAHLLALVDNKLGEIAEWDDALVTSILSEYGLEDAALAGFDQKELDKIAKDMAGDDSGKIDDSFAVVIECDTEEMQREIISVCEENGWPCRALI